jgi:RimJ/RimL family protein N-acetyltransferase
MQAPILSDGLCIRPLVDADIDPFVAAARESVDTVGAWMPWCLATYSAKEAKVWIDECVANLAARSAYDMGIFSHDGATFLGGIGVNQISWRWNYGNVGYWVRQSCQRRGIAPRAVRAAAQFGFGYLKLTRLEIVVAIGNKPSRRVAERVGATFECIARNRLVLNDRPIDAAVYSLIPGPLAK